MCTHNAHSCTHTYSPARRAGRREQNLSGCHGDIASFRWSEEAVWLPGGTEQSRAEALRWPACITSSSLPFSSVIIVSPFISSASFFSLCLIYPCQALASVSFVLFCVCVYLSPQLIQKSHHQPSGESGLSEPGARGLRLRCHLRIKDEAAEPAAHPCHTFISNLLMCFLWCDPPSISISTWQAGDKGLLEPVSSVLAASLLRQRTASHRLPSGGCPEKNEDVQRLSGKGTVTGNMWSILLTFGAVAEEQQPKH